MPSTPQSVPVVVLFDYLLNDAGAALAGERVIVTLNAPSPITTISPLTVLTTTQQQTTTDGNGYWQFSLVPNSNIAPANTLYTVQTPAGTYDVTLGSVGPYQSTALGTIVNVPSALQAPANTTISGTLTVGNLLVAPGETGIDTTSAGVLEIGGDNATTVELGKANVLVDANGNIAAGSLTVLASGPYTSLLADGVTPTPGGVAYGKFWDYGGVGFNVMAAGAKGDGVTNDRAAFARAEAAAGAVKGAVLHSPGTYAFAGNPIIPQSGVAHIATKGSVLIKKTDAGDVYSNSASPGTLTTVSWLGIAFDMTLTGWSAIGLTGSDAGGQVSDVLIDGCSFKNPAITWMVRIDYTIVDPAVPTSKNKNIRLVNCLDDCTGQTFTLENLIFVNCQDVLVTNNRFLNATAVMAAHVAAYGYCRNVRFVANYIEQWLSARAVYFVQSDSISVLGDQFRTTAAVTCIQVFNCKDVKTVGCQMVTSSTGVGIWIDDFSGTTFDGHTNLYSASTGISSQMDRIDIATTAVLLSCDQVQGQSDIVVEGCMAAVTNNLFRIFGIPNAPTATLQRVTIRNNHVISHGGTSGGNACIAINGNAVAANGGIQNVFVTGNLINNPGQGGCDIEVFNKADTVTITNNHDTVGALVPHVIAAAATNVVCVNNVRSPEVPTATTNKGANVTSVTATGNNYRGTAAIVMAGALAANTRIVTWTWTHSPFGATAPIVRLIDQTSGAALANVNFYATMNGTGQTFDLFANQALAAGTYTFAYDVVPAGLN